MNSLLNKLLKILRGHVNQNNREIRYNQEEINRIISENNPSSMSNELDNKYSLNKELLDENTDFINLQIAISEFKEKYGHFFSSLEKSSGASDENSSKPESSNDNLFLETIGGTIIYDNNHPRFGDPVFFNRLLNYYKECEDYEMCNNLLKIVKSHP